MAARKYCQLFLVLFVVTSSCESTATVSDSHPQAVTVVLPKAGLYYGNVSAPVVLVEFGSFACSICRQFSVVVFPKIDSLYIRSGQVRYRYVDLSPSGLFSQYGLINDCVSDLRGLPTAKQFVFDSLTTAIPDAPQTIAIAAAYSGVPVERMELCTHDAHRIQRRLEEGRSANSLGVIGTPTFIVGQIDENGRVVGWPFIGLGQSDSLETLIGAAARAVARTK